MARPWRIQYEGAVYHVMSRGTGRQSIFFDKQDYLQFIQYLEKTTEKFNLDVFAFILMTNHYHLLLRINQTNLSKALQWIQTSYAVYFNRRHKHSGHFFQGRYKSMLVGDESYWHRLSVYIHLNPVRAGMVKRIMDYPYSSYPDYISKKKTYEWLKSDEVLKGMGRTRKERAENYKQLIMDVTGTERDILDDIRYGFILGNDDFMDWVQQKFTSKKSNLKDISSYSSIRDRGIGEEVIARTMEAFNIGRHKLIQAKRRRPNLARDIAIHLLHAKTSMGNTAIGNLFGITTSAVTKASWRIGEGIKKDKSLKEKVSDLNNSIFKV